MKSLIFCVSFFLVTISIQAQWSFGPKVGYGFIVQKASPIEVVTQSEFGSYDLRYVGSTAVRSIGFMTEQNLGPVFLQAEFLASNYSSDFFLNGYKAQYDNPTIYRETYYFMEIPFNAGVRFNNFKIGAGPVVDVILDKNSELATNEDYRDTSKSTDFGFQGLVGYNYGIFHFDIKYINKFTGLVDGFTLGFDNFRYNKSANRLTFSIGAAF